MEAIILANALVCTSPYADQKKSENNWKKFMDVLTWDKDMKEEAKKSPLNILRKLGLPVVKT